MRLRFTTIGMLSKSYNICCCGQCFKRFITNTTKQLLIHQRSLKLQKLFFWAITENITTMLKQYSLSNTTDLSIFSTTVAHTKREKYVTNYRKMLFPFIPAPGQQRLSLPKNTLIHIKKMKYSKDKIESPKKNLNINKFSLNNTTIF